MYRVSLAVCFNRCIRTMPKCANVLVNERERKRLSGATVCIDAIAISNSTYHPVKWKHTDSRCFSVFRGVVNVRWAAMCDDAECDASNKRCTVNIQHISKIAEIPISIHVCMCCVSVYEYSVSDRPTDRSTQNVQTCVTLITYESGNTECERIHSQVTYENKHNDVYVPPCVYFHFVPINKTKPLIRTNPIFSCKGNRSLSFVRLQRLKLCAQA